MRSQARSRANRRTSRGSLPIGQQATRGHPRAGKLQKHFRRLKLTVSKTKAAGEPANRAATQRLSPAAPNFSKNDLTKKMKSRDEDSAPESKKRPRLYARVPVKPPPEGLPDIRGWVVTRR